MPGSATPTKWPESTTPGRSQASEPAYEELPGKDTEIAGRASQ